MAQSRQAAARGHRAAGGTIPVAEKPPAWTRAPPRAPDCACVIEPNSRLSMRLLDWCTATATPFIYASSASTYGDGAQGFRDDPSMSARKWLRPMNLYGWSKHLFDMAVAERAARGEKLPPQWAGLKFFNVFGPHEYHKGTMMSVLARRFDDIKAGRRVPW